MADFTLKSGKAITFDTDAFTAREYKQLFDPAQPSEHEFAILAKASGLTVEEIAEMPHGEWRRFFKAFMKRATEPIADPN